jgi:hypothetical protein
MTTQEAMPSATEGVAFCVSGMALDMPQEKTPPILHLRRRLALLRIELVLTLRAGRLARSVKTTLPRAQRLYLRGRRVPFRHHGSRSI